MGFEFVKVFVETGNTVATIVRNESAKKIIEKHYPKCTVLVADITKYPELDKLDYLKNNSIDAADNLQVASAANQSIEAIVLSGAVAITGSGSNAVRSR